MKKLAISVLGLVVLATTACNKKRHVVITENNNGNRLKIEYVGRTEFNDEGTAIKRITPNGYVKYDKNDSALLAESDEHGSISYEFNDGPRKNSVSDIERKFLILAIKDMIRHGHNND